MIYRPTISILHSQDSSCSIQDEIRLHWPSSQPFINDSEYKRADLALFIAESHGELVSYLPILIELHSSKIPTVILCDDIGDLKQFISELNISQLPTNVPPKVLTGLLFGMLERCEEISELRSQIGLMKTLHHSLKDEYTLIENELNAAAIVQREFMSNNVPAVHGATFSTLWKPLGVVSGDIFDITQLDDNHVAFFIADAIGHGIPAAMLAMMLTRTLASNRFDPISGQYTEPKDLLINLNESLLQRIGDQARFATAAYGILNCKTNELKYAGAGHPPAILNKSNASYKLLDSGGPLLGVFDNADDFSQQCVQLDCGDTLLVYSDGFESIFGTTSHEDRKTPRYIEAISKFCDQKNVNTLGRITKYLDNTLPSTIEDDLTMICLQTASKATCEKLAA